MPYDLSISVDGSARSSKKMVGLNMDGRCRNSKRDGNRRNGIFSLRAILSVVVTVALVVQACKLVHPASTRYLYASPDDIAITATKREGRVVPTTTAKMCPRKGPGSFRKSQEGEDALAWQWFNGLCGGRYLEMGAANGVVFSNTYALHHVLQWKGLLIEMSPVHYRELVNNRPDDITVNAAVCDEPRTLHYWFNAEKRFIGGVWEFTSPAFRGRYWQGVKLEDTTPVECAPMNQILDEKYRDEDYHYFDFYSLDVEGAELMVLQSIDFSKTGFGIIVLEADNTNERRNLAIRTFLESRGYLFLERQSRNDWFVNEMFGDIYANLIHADDLKKE